ncbi:hypothetical protein OS493_030386 [Desmophyllum pertusum]|uniref:Uncharacterized protein n=1 Tax=Desmophyllum pertusum TaxID=174260 RepID=A0A9X0CVK3_9CNID|nr:hypothetical protein OS493_030386 [Desmophyllum pertusum]
MTEPAAEQPAAALAAQNAEETAHQNAVAPPTHEEATCKTPDRKEANLTTTPAAEPPHVALRPTPVSSRRTAERSSKTAEPGHAEIAEPVHAEITEPGHAESRPRRIVKEPAYLKDYVRK